MRAQVINHGDLTQDSRFPDRNPDNPMYACRLLAEGDSWFTLGAVPSSNILFNIETSKRAALVTIAFPGDTILRMGDPAHMQQLRRLLVDPRFLYKWDTILLSGGGNDLISVAGALLPKRGITSTSASDYVDPAELQKLIGDIQQAYRNIVDVRDEAGSPNSGVPIVAHTYDYPTPRDSPSRFLGVGVKGPWLQPALTAAEIPAAMWQPISDYLLDQVAEAILALDSGATGSQQLPSFHVVDTRNTLARAAPDTTSFSGDWANEIHPDTTGYSKLAAKISARVNL